MCISTGKLDFVLFITVFCTVHGGLLKDKTESVELEYLPQDDGLEIIISKDYEIKLSGKLDVGKSYDFTTDCHFDETETCKIQNSEEQELTIQPLDNGFQITWIRDRLDSVMDCYDLDTINDTHWYGGPEVHNQLWPIEKLIINGSYPYVISNRDGRAIAERYWLHSNGTQIYIDEQTPLWIDQNNQYEGQLCLIGKVAPPYIRNFTMMSYFLGIADDAKSGHLKIVYQDLGKATGHPNIKMITEPIWTTWAKYKKNINAQVVLDFAQDIRNHGYEGGQIEIDDNWEKCYGSQEFDTDKFPNITDTILKLKEDNFRVTLWVHQFVDDSCQDNSNTGKDNGYFVTDITGNNTISWWNSDNSHQIDFTNPDAVQWFTDRLIQLQATVGIDSFKFDGGETDYIKNSPVFPDQDLQPNIITTDYSQTCAQFGDLIETRVAYRSQAYPNFVRMLDKDSKWGTDNGLASLITTLLQMNINGYGMVLPDMIGGNGYDIPPTAELLIRWTQANTFMPAMQFSYLPWDYANETYDTETIVKKYVDLHQEYAPKIIDAMEANINNGTPVNSPIWWIDPTDQVALGISDEFLLGEDILVAPVIQEGATSRDVYLPVGRWQDGNDNSLYEGPTTITAYNASIDILPWFILV